MKNKSYTTIVGCLLISLMACLLYGCDDDTIKPDNEQMRTLCNTVWRGHTNGYIELQTTDIEVSLSFLPGKVEGTSGYESKTGETGMMYLSYRNYRYEGVRKCNYCYEDGLLRLAMYALDDHRWVLKEEYVFIVENFTPEYLDLGNVDQISDSLFRGIYLVRVKK